MTTEIIKHKYLQDCFIERDSETGSCHEIKALPPGEKPRKKASYVKHKDTFIGVFASTQGPVLFINQKLFFFTDQSWVVKLNKQANGNQFTLLQNGQKLFEADYHPPKPDPLDPWSDEESVDLFVWITAKRNDQEIAQMWTLEQ